MTIHSALSLFLRPARFYAAFSLLLAITSTRFAQAQNADAILGKWLTGTGKANIEVYKDKGKYYGKIIWLKNPLTPEGKPKIDKNNPEEGMRDRPLLGLVNLYNFTYGEDEYEDGKIYDPESGKTYSCVMTLKDPNTLAVRGYIGISLIGRTDTWTRVQE